MNWELYPMVLPLQQPLLLVGVYMPISNAAMNKIFIRLRARFGTALVPANDVKNGLQGYEGIPNILALGADQSPSKPAQAHWTYFLHQPTAFPTGPARNACRTQVPVVFTWIEKIRRGRYRFHAELITDNPQLLGEAELTRLYACKLEEVIRRHPDNYLWSHRRWKHAWKEEYRANWIDHAPPPAA
jgi:KDO2-lipid IV(A) lauroyltransferase